MRLAATIAIVLTAGASFPLQAQTVSGTAPSAPAATAVPKPSRPPRKQEDAVTPALREPKRHAEFLYRITEGDIGLLFLGDSITDWWPRNGEWSWLKFAPYKPANFGVAGDRTENVLWRITNGELEGNTPRVIVIMIGTNNIGAYPDEKPEWAAAGIKRIVEVVHEKLPDTKVLLLGVFPRDTAGHPRRKQIEEINRSIASLNDGNRTRYMDVGARFLNEQGEFQTDVMTGMLHPTAKGYDIWCDAILPVIAEMMK